MPSEELTLRDLSSHDDYDRCVALQRATWGEDFRELVPPAVLMIAQKVGGLSVGAFDARGELVGLLFGLTGVADGRLTHWSHILAVREDLRDHSIGRRLKTWQRDRLRALGIERILWTFDPLGARNAHLNLNRLGVRVVEYARDMYVEDPMSLIDHVIGTDRLVVEWAIAETARQHDAPPVASTDSPIVSTGDAQAPALDLPAVPEVRVEIPEDIHALKLEESEAATTWRMTTRRAFLHYQGLGYAIVGFVRRPDTHRCFYVIQRVDRPGA